MRQVRLVAPVIQPSTSGHLSKRKKDLFKCTILSSEKKTMASNQVTSKALRITILTSFYSNTDPHTLLKVELRLKLGGGVWEVMLHGRHT